MNIYLGVGLELVKWHLEGMYGRVEEGRDEEGRRILRVRSQTIDLNLMVLILYHRRSWAPWMSNTLQRKNSR